MPKGAKNMDSNPDEQLLIMKYKIKANKKDSDDKMMKLTQDFIAMITSEVTSMIYHTNS